MRGGLDVQVRADDIQTGLSHRTSRVLPHPLTLGAGRRSRLTGAMATAAFVAGGSLLIWSGDIHFVLWHSVGYRSLHTIGPLFVVQSVVGLVLGLGVLAVRRVWAGILGVGFAASTVGGFLLSVLLPHGLFGFKDSWLAPFAKQAFGVEVAAVAVLLLACGLCLAAAWRGEQADSGG